MSVFLLVVYSVIKRKFARLMLNGAENRECVPQVTNKINEYSMNYILLINEMQCIRLSGSFLMRVELEGVSK